ncbi:MAG: hypothetical protein ACK5QW_08440 [Cyanobacteriota bacterium]
MTYRTKKLAGGILFVGLAVALMVLLFGIVHHHFSSFSLTRLPNRLDSAGQAKARVHYQAYIPESEVREKVSTPPDRQVLVGLQIENFYALSLKDRTFSAEGWYWLKWKNNIQAIIDDNQIPLTELVEFTNQVDASSMVVEPDMPKPQRTVDGYYLQSFRFSGVFYIEELQLRAFPFNALNLPLALELRPDYLSCYPGNRYGCIGLAFDEKAQKNLLGQFVGMNGFDVNGTKSFEFLHQYSTNFGNGEPSAFSAVQVDVLYLANDVSSFWIYIFPLLILVGIAILSPSLPGALGDVRLAIPTTILLTLIFLQIGYKAELPALSYVSYLDWLYIYAYLITAAFFVLFCWGTNAFASASSAGQEESVVRRINRVDALVQVLALAGLVTVLAAGLVIQP